MLRVLMKKGVDMKEQMGNTSRKVEILRQNQKQCNRNKEYFC